MKYYIGKLVLTDHSSDREYERQVCVVAANDIAAQRELDTFASEWDSDGEQNESGGWLFGDSDRSYTVFAGSLREISAVTFDELAAIMTSLGDLDKVTLVDKTPADSVKAVCHRLSEQLTKLGISVPSAKLLQAASAALGATGWAQLKAKVSGGAKPVTVAATRFTLPSGNPKREPLRSAEGLDLAARVDAIWLADGDVELAARLLHVDGEDLMSSFQSAGEADVAFCSRPAAWKPEHSLARDYGILADKRFDVKTQHLYPGHTQVQGWYDGHESIGFNDHISGNWHMGGLTVPSGTLDEIRHQLACFYETLRYAVEARRKSPVLR